MAKRVKKYNPNKTKRIVGAGALKASNLVLFYCVGFGFKSVKLLSLHDFSLNDPTRSIYNAIASSKHHWYYTLFALCRTQTGEEYVKAWYPDFIDPVTKKPITDSIELSHVDAAASMEQPHSKALKNTVNPLHLITTGWITAPYNRRVEPEEISRLADTHNIWADYLSRWEQEALNN